MNALFVLCGTGVFTLLAEVFNLRKWIISISLAGLAVATVMLLLDWTNTSYAFNGMILLDHFSRGFMVLITVSCFSWFLIFGDYFTEEEEHRSDKASLVLFATVGATLMVAFNNMAILFLGIEILSISLYALAGSRKGSMFSNEASFKYFLMGSFATGFLLFGIALVYGATGSFSITEIISVLQSKVSTPMFFRMGVLLMLVGLAFKISAVPFHFWAPDVYHGSPTPVTSFMSTVVKVAAFYAFIKIVAVAFARVHAMLLPYEQAIMVLTLIVANITAAYQRNVKRMLAYSSVGHVGYLLLALSSSPRHSPTVIFYYLAVYSAASLLAFGVLQVMERNKNGISLEDFRGLYKKNPLLAFSMAVAMLSLAGIPPLSGFFAKYQVFTIAIEYGHPKLVLFAVITSLIGVYYYFRPIIALYRSEGNVELKLTVRDRISFVLLIFVNLALSIFPEIIRIQ
jgi:NADH-quinone oxidoreductase subunit N